MFNISQLLNRIRSIQSKGMVGIILVHDSILKNVGIDIPLGDISIKSSVVSIKNISQSAKSAIYIKKQAILKDINKDSVNPIAREIR